MTTLAFLHMCCTILCGIQCFLFLFSIPDDAVQYLEQLHEVKTTIK